MNIQPSHLNLQLYCKKTSSRNHFQLFSSSLVPGTSVQSCLYDFNEDHKQKQTFPQIDSLKGATLRSIKKCQFIRSNISQQFDSFIRVNELPQQFFQESVEELRKLEKEIQTAIKVYFQQIEQDLRKSAEIASQQLQQVEVVSNKINATLKDIQILEQQLQSHDSVVLDAIQKVTLIDENSLIDRIKGEIVKNTGSLIVEQAVLNPSEEFKRALFTQDLKKYIPLTSYKHTYSQQKNLVGNTSNNSINNNRIQQQQNQQMAITPPAVSPIRQNSMGMNMNNSNNQLSSQPRQFPTFSQPQVLKQQGNQFFQPEQNPIQSQNNLSSSQFGNVNQFQNQQNVINHNNYFLPTTDKYLHFFENEGNRLFILPISSISGNSKPQFQVIRMNNTFQTPSFHRSIALPSGELILIGGTLEHIKKKSASIYKFNFSKLQLVEMTSMNTPRSSFTLCFSNEYIYILGGYQVNHMISSAFERIHMSLTKPIEILPDYPIRAASLAFCAFNNILAAFGGITIANGKQDISQQMFIFDQNQWSGVQLRSTIPSLFLSCSAAHQMNNTEILVFGGYNNQNKGQSTSFTLSMLNKNTFSVENYNLHPLPFGEAFWNCQVIVEGARMFALQNKSDGDGSCKEDERIVVIYDGDQFTSF